MLAIIQEIGVIQSVIIALCLGFLLGMLAVIVGERRKKKQHLVDYVDWSKVGGGYDWVATDEHGATYRYKGAASVIEEDMEDGGYWRVGPGGGFWFATDILEGSAIIGPLPPWRESLRRRPS